MFQSLEWNPGQGVITQVQENLVKRVGFQIIEHQGDTAQEYMVAFSKKKPTDQVHGKKTSVTAMVCHLSDHHQTAGYSLYCRKDGHREHP